MVKEAVCFWYWPKQKKKGLENIGMSNINQIKPLLQLLSLPVIMYILDIIIETLASGLFPFQNI